MLSRSYIEKVFKDNKELISQVDFNSLYPGNLKVNIVLCKVLKEYYSKLDIEKKQLLGLIKLYLKEGNVKTAFCKVCGRLCNVRSDYSFFDTCCKKCGRVLAGQSTSKTYNNKTEEEKQKIKNRRKDTCIKRFGVSNNLNSKEVLESRKSKYNGSISPFNDKDIREKVKLNNAERHNGLVNSFQWEETKGKISDTKLEKYGDSKYNNVEKAQETCIDKYGVKSYLQTEGFKEQAKETCLEKYGVEHPMQSSEIVNKIMEKNRSKYGKNWCISTYGVEYNCMRKEVRDKSAARSKLNAEWKEYLGIKEEEFAIGKYLYDLKKGNLLIEIDPTITHNSTISIFKNDSPKDKYYHLNKSKLAEGNGYRCIHVWDWDNPEKIKYMLLDKKVLYGRQLDIREVDKETCDEFLYAYHLQNSCRGQNIRLGLYRGDELVELMTFGTPRYNKECQYELLRLCTKCDYKVVGGAEKLFKEFIKLYNPDSIVSYCDRSKFNGDVYKRLGFILRDEGKPNKHWYKSSTQQHFTDNLLRFQGADRLIGTNYGKGTSNEQIMIENKFLEIYDCGQSTYIWKKDESNA